MWAFLRYFILAIEEMFTLKLIKETILIGLSFGVVGFIVSTLFMFLPNSKDKKPFEFKDYHFWWQVFLSSVVAGSLFHLLCDFSGVNRWSCRNGNACN